MKDYYAVLGVTKDSTQDEIKKAYRKKSMETHPDKGGDEEKFKEVAEAYEILSNTEKKSNYDKFGDPNKSSDIQFDSFRDFFNAHMNPFGKRKPMGENLGINLTLSLEEIYTGTNKKIKYKRNKKCGECSGSGGKNTIKCSGCGGNGVIIEQTAHQFGYSTNTYPCQQCGGGGNINEINCDTCSGKGVNQVEEELDIFIPHGISNGMQMLLKGNGSAVKGSNEGDLIITLNEQPHSKFVRKNDNLRLKLNLFYHQLVLGDRVEIDLVDGAKIRINIPKLTKTDTILKVVGKGMKIMNTDNFGDLLIEIGLEFPYTFKEDELKLIEELKNYYTKGGGMEES
jgi:molecular chaperone DnaJ